MKDVYTDNGALLRERFPRLEDVPEMVKSAADLHEVLPRMRDDDFALVTDGQRLYPVADPGNTALSVIYFLDTAADAPAALRKNAAERLVAACAEYGLQPPGALVDLAKDPSPAEMERDTPDAVRAKLAFFVDNHTSHAPPDRRHVAIELSRQAAVHAIEVPPLVAKYAADTLADDFPLHIRARTLLLEEGSEYAGVYNYVLDKVAEVSPTEVAVLLYEIDKAAGLTAYYDGQLNDPFAACHGRPAPEKPPVAFVGDTAYDASAIRKLAAVHVDLLSEEVRAELEADPVGTFMRLPAAVKQCLTG